MRALISVSDKSGLVPFAKELHNLGIQIISTGGTFQLLKDNQIPAIPIDAVTGFPEMLDGRVKTLHPKIHGGLLALRDNPDHMSICNAHAIEMIDIVVVNLYPFEATIKKPDVTLEEAIENIDIGGPSMIRSAAKNYRSVAVIVNPDRYARVVEELKSNKGQISSELKAQLALEAFDHTGRYDTIIAAYLKSRFETTADAYPETLAPVLSKVADLRYGENPHQSAAFYTLNNRQGFPNFVQLHGKELSYNNIVDMEAAWQICREFQLPGAAIIKHTNPCGAAIGQSISEAYRKAYETDPVSAFGSIVGLNREVDKETAEQLAKSFVEVVIAPGFDEKAFEILSKKSAIRLIRLSDFYQADPPHSFRYVSGGFLVQKPDAIVVDPTTLKTVTQLEPSVDLKNDLEFAFSLVKHVKSNAIVIAKGGTAIGVGAGQMSRIDSVEIALKEAGEGARGAVLASDAFFPFRDSVDTVAKAGITAIIQPGGSKRDQESIDACNEHGISMIFTDIRHFKH